LGHFCGHWAIFSQKHLVILTLDESVDTFNESHTSLKVFCLWGQAVETLKKKIGFVGKIRTSAPALNCLQVFFSQKVNSKQNENLDWDSQKSCKHDTLKSNKATFLYKPDTYYILQKIRLASN
jgi:hypothetical protein